MTRAIKVRKCSLCPLRLFATLVGDDWIVYWCEHCDRAAKPVPS